jgi:hypothetical protein
LELWTMDMAGREALFLIESVLAFTLTVFAG